MGIRRAVVTTFLAPNMVHVYEAIVAHLSQKLRYPMDLVVGTSYREAYTSEFSFICGLPYVLRASSGQATSLMAIAAPVLWGTRYQNKPIYFSDVIVRKESNFQSFADLRGHSWAYNEPESQSGYGITRYWLAKSQNTAGYFSKVIEAGFHQTAIRMVYEGQVDGSAIDSLVLQTEFRRYPELAAGLRIIDSLGPSTIQPLTAASHTPLSLIEHVRATLMEIHLQSSIGDLLRQADIDHFVAVSDADYDDIRAMLAVCEAANFLTLK
jgi:phosphonate transport system substrate-binding protein